MSKELQLEIPTPCTENWSQMTPDANGRFCSSCAKTVLDFTVMEDKEILQWFANHQGSACGRFRPDQLDRPIVIPPEKKAHWRYWHYLIAGLLFSSEVSAQTKPAAPPMSQHDNNIIQGKMTAMPHPAPKADSIRGRVTDTKGGPVSFAMIKYDKRWGVETDAYGYFSIPVNKVTPQTMLYITALGYTSDSIAAKQFLATNEIQLIPLLTENVLLGEVVVVGGIQKKPKPKPDTISILKDTLIAIGVLPKPLTVYPNPVAKGNQITVAAKFDQTGTYTIQLYSMAGTLVQTTQINGALKTPKLSMTIPANLTPGTYVVRVSHAALTKSYSQEIVVF